MVAVLVARERRHRAEDADGAGKKERLLVVVIGVERPGHAVLAAQAEDIEEDVEPCRIRHSLRAHELEGLKGCQISPGCEALVPPTLKAVRGSRLTRSAPRDLKRSTLAPCPKGEAKQPCRGEVGS